MTEPRCESPRAALARLLVDGLSMQEPTFWRHPRGGSVFLLFSGDRTLTLCIDLAGDHYAPAWLLSAPGIPIESIYDWTRWALERGFASGPQSLALRHVEIFS